MSKCSPCRERSVSPADAHSGQGLKGTGRQLAAVVEKGTETGLLTYMESRALRVTTQAPGSCGTHVA